MESETAYSLLNVSRTASSEEILLAYRKESLKFHPQRFDSSDSFIQVHFKKLAEAYETLIDPQKRLEYDRQLILKKLKGSKSRKDDVFNSSSAYPPPSRPGSCAPAIETTRFVQRAKPNNPVQIKTSTPANLSTSSQPILAWHDRHHHIRPTSTLYQNLNVHPEQQPIVHRTRPRADSFTSTSIKPATASAPPVYPPGAVGPRRFNPSTSAPSSAASRTSHRLPHPSDHFTSSQLDQYQPLTSTLPTPRPRLASNSISSTGHQYPQYYRHLTHYR